MQKLLSSLHFLAEPEDLLVVIEVDVSVFLGVVFEELLDHMVSLVFGSEFLELVLLLPDASMGFFNQQEDVPVRVGQTDQVCLVIIELLLFPDQSALILDDQLSFVDLLMNSAPESPCLGL